MSATVEQSPLPTRLAVRATIEGLIGRDIDVTDGQPVSNSPTNVVAVYVTDKLHMTAVAVADLRAAACFGGALGMLPRGGVEDAIAEKELFGLMRDNCYEVLNVLASVFNVPDSPHVRLYEMHGPGGTLPTDVATLCATVGQRMDLTVKVAGYGSGLLSIVAR